MLKRSYVEKLRIELPKKKIEMKDFELYVDDSKIDTSKVKTYEDLKNMFINTEKPVKTNSKKKKRK